MRGLVAPIMAAHDLPRVLRPLDHHRHDRAAAHERDEIVVEALADVLLVVAGERLLVERAQVEGHDRAGPLASKRATIVADQPALDGVGLEQDEGAIRHKAATLPVGHPCSMASERYANPAAQARTTRSSHSDLSAVPPGFLGIRHLVTLIVVLPAPRFRRRRHTTNVFAATRPTLRP